MMTKKGILLQVLIIILCLGLCACGKNEATEADTEVGAFDAAKADISETDNIISDDAQGKNVTDVSEDEAVADNDTGSADEEPDTVEVPQLIELTKNADGYVLLGEYEQDNDTSNGPEPIEWTILDENENGILLLSRYALECKPYNNNSDDTTWETCSLREWMNNDFYNDAFSDDEKKLINTTKLVNEDNRVYGTDCGNDTEDKVFALSTSEAIEYFELNDYWDDKDIGFSEESIAEATPHVISQNALIYTLTAEELAGESAYLHYSSESIGKKGVCWWLRSHGGSGICVDNVDYIGEFGPGFYGSYQTYADYCARPALYIFEDTVIK